MPSTTNKKISSDRASVSDPVRAGGSPPGETPAPRLGLGEPRSQISEGVISDAVDRARLRSIVDSPAGGRIPDEVIDGLLAGGRTEEELAGPGGLLAQLTSGWWSGRWRSS